VEKKDREKIIRMVENGQMTYQMLSKKGEISTSYLWKAAHGMCKGGPKFLEAIKKINGR